MTTYETGATSHAVNDLILFTDNTRELAEMRDCIYRDAATPGTWHYMRFNESKSQGLFALKRGFRKLLTAATNRYIKEMPDACNHIKSIKHWDKEAEEFCELYAKDFEVWKEENRA